MQDVSFPPELAGRYQIRGYLGHGGTARVFRAYDTDLDREVALKLLANPTDDLLRQRFAREAEALARVRHEGVLEVYDHGLSSTGAYLVTEVLEGYGFQDWPPGADPLAAMLLVAKGLEAVHAADLLHRDIKPGNIFRCTDGRVVLLDFGLALDPDRTRMTNLGRVVGTLGYLAPEIMKGYDSEVASDWFSWGVTLYQLYEGELPFSSEEIMGTLDDRRLPAPRFTAATPDPAARALLTRVLAEDPADRVAGLAAIERCLAAAGADVGRLSSQRMPPLGQHERGPPLERPEAGNAGKVVFLAGCTALSTALGLAMPRFMPRMSPPPPPPQAQARGPISLREAPETQAVRAALAALRAGFGDVAETLERDLDRTDLVAHLTEMLPSLTDPRLPARWARYLDALREWFLLLSARHAAGGTAEDLPALLDEVAGVLPLGILRDYDRLWVYIAFDETLTETVEALRKNRELKDAALERRREVVSRTVSSLLRCPPLPGIAEARRVELLALCPGARVNELLEVVDQELTAAPPQHRLRIAQAATFVVYAGRRDIQHRCEIAEAAGPVLDRLHAAVAGLPASAAKAEVATHAYGAYLRMLIDCQDLLNTQTRDRISRLRLTAELGIEVAPARVARLLEWYRLDHEVRSFLVSERRVQGELDSLRSLHRKAGLLARR